MLKVEDLPSVREQQSRAEMPAEEGGVAQTIAGSTTVNHVQAFSVGDLPDLKAKAACASFSTATVEYARAPDGPGFQLGSGRAHAIQRNSR